MLAPFPRFVVTSDADAALASFLPQALRLGGLPLSLICLFSWTPPYRASLLVGLECAELQTLTKDGDLSQTICVPLNGLGTLLGILVVSLSPGVVERAPGM